MADELVPRADLEAVPFEGGYLPAVRLDGEPHVIPRPVVEDIGLAWQGQYAKLVADPSVCVRLVVTQLPGDDQARQVVAIDLDAFSLWISSIQPNRVGEHARDAVVALKRKAGRVLREYFFGRPGQPLDEIVVAERYLQALREKKALAERNSQLVAQVAELEPLADAYEHFLESDGTFKWANAAQLLGVGPNLLGDYLRQHGYTRTDEYFDSKGEKRAGEQHNRPYAAYAPWFHFPHYRESERLHGVPEHRQYDRRVTKIGLDALLRLLRRHVRECGTCGLCGSLRRNKPDRFAEFRKPPRGGQLTIDTGDVA